MNHEIGKTILILQIYCIYNYMIKFSSIQKSFQYRRGPYTSNLLLCKIINLFATIIAREFFGMVCKYWISSHGRIKCNVSLILVVFLIIEVRSQFLIIVLINFLHLQHFSCCNKSLSFPPTSKLALTLLFMDHDADHTSPDTGCIGN
jgi:hypothetical protein